MTHVINSQDLINLDAVNDSITPIARLSLEPKQLSNGGTIEFVDGFDGLDYLVFSTIELKQLPVSYLVKHQNAPEPGTLIYLEPKVETIGLQMSQTLDAIGLGLDQLDWVHPDFRDEIMQHQDSASFRRTLEGQIQLVIQGPGAEDAARELVGIADLEASYKLPSGDKKEAGTLAVIATIVGIVGGTMAIAEQIRKWYQEYKQANSDKKIEKVLIVGPKGQRILLENATLEQISKIFEN